MRGLRSTSQADSAHEPQPARAAFTAELEQLKLQVELMGLKVEEALGQATRVLETGDRELAATVVAGDDQIDDMLVSLTERCYEVLSRQGPVASDLRLIVSILRITTDLERAGDLCLRIVNLVPLHHLISEDPQIFQVLTVMGGQTRRLFRAAIRAWSTEDLKLAKSLETQDDKLDASLASLTGRVEGLQGPDAVPTAIAVLNAGRALERIADHAVMIGERIRYLLTGNLESLSKEIGP